MSEGKWRVCSLKPIRFPRNELVTWTRCPFISPWCVGALPAEVLTLPSAVVPYAGTLVYAIAQDWQLHLSLKFVCAE